MRLSNMLCVLICVLVLIMPQNTAGRFVDYFYGLEDDLITEEAEPAIINKLRAVKAREDLQEQFVGSLFEEVRSAVDKEATQEFKVLIARAYKEAVLRVCTHVYQQRGVRLVEFIEDVVSARTAIERNKLSIEKELNKEVNIPVKDRTYVAIELGSFINNVKNSRIMDLMESLIGPSSTVVGDEISLRMWIADCPGVLMLKYLTSASDVRALEHAFYDLFLIDVDRMEFTISKYNSLSMLQYQKNIQSSLHLVLKGLMREKSYFQELARLLSTHIFRSVRVGYYINSPGDLDKHSTADVAGLLCLEILRYKYHGLAHRLQIVIPEIPTLSVWQTTAGKTGQDQAREVREGLQQVVDLKRYAVDASLYDMFLKGGWRTDVHDMLQEDSAILSKNKVSMGQVAGRLASNIQEAAVPQPPATAPKKEESQSAATPPKKSSGPTRTKEQASEPKDKTISEVLIEQAKKSGTKWATDQIKNLFSQAGS